jgi:WD40 repeat protein
VFAGGDRQAAGAPVEHVTHVHGLAVAAWAPQTVLMATHHGLVSIEDSAWSYVGDQRHDFMGFAAHPTEPGVLYTSGHPSLASDLANPTGLLVSTDGGHTWQVRSLAGQADSHALSVGASGAVIYGWNVEAGQVGLLRSTDDGHTWQTQPAAALHAAEAVLALAAHSDDPQMVWAATTDGLLRSDDGGAQWQPAQADAPVTAVSFDPDGATRPGATWKVESRATGGLRRPWERPASHRRAGRTATRGSGSRAEVA